MKTLLFALLLSLSACTATNVESVNEAPGVNFAAYRTYNFLDVSARNEAAFQSPLNGVEELKSAIAAQLERRGYQRAEQPDVWVNIGIVTQQRVQTRETTIRDAPVYLGQRRYAWRSQEVPVREYTEGTATVELVDAARNEQVWEGAVAGVLTDKPETLSKRIDEAIAELFERYPVKPQQP
ncbi:DUF4136 domain-containing protein [Hymenobacter oligotrophus]|uniref:DUF4136 domain-containing protein n=1 Tax=Hymenobacter oligotrophus TaxID=2319843 RepID=A0A3B7R4K4_9BACT|nr:DUF4136 domain-containing protein [Hymenobacter oligotrophus]AYA38702.1 DUF4136 domain-containing protein [Hymenobacter oligotrophus]